ncbi:MAG: CaiB/BaiF CoA transferase family protein [Actinomycetota bacterium]
MDGNPEGPLAGALVVDLTVTLPGPYAASLLQRLGARVVKFEPRSGDVTRMFPHAHEALNRGKESVAADLKDPGDLALVRAACARAAVVIEGWRPGVAARLGVGYDELSAINPGLVYCSISGYGSNGALRDRAGHDLNYVAASGMAGLLFGNRVPHPLGVPLADLGGGTFAALRILGALLERASTGKGAFLDVSLHGAVREWVEAIGGASNLEPLELLDGLPHYGVFETADGHKLTLGTVHEDHFWKALCGALGLDGLEDLGLLERAERVDEIKPLVADAIGGRTRDELERVLVGADTCWAFVDPSIGERRHTGTMPFTSEPAPSLDEHGDAIRREFGASD